MYLFTTQKIALAFSALVFLAMPSVHAASGSEFSIEDENRVIELAKAQKCTELSPKENTNLGIVTQILNEKKPYAALAFIESFDIDSPRLELLKAHGLRQTGNYEKAQAIYQKLTTSCVAGFAYQGLGQVSSALEKHQASAGYLKLAAKILPIDSAIRGDYGFALMRLKDYETAFQEYLTAIELDGRNVRARNNLIHLLYLTRQTDKAEQFAQKYGIGREALEEIRDDALTKSTDS